MDKYITAVGLAISGEFEYKDWPGILNYIITKLLLSTSPTNYYDYNSLVGVLECCKLEFYRRAVAAYENVKIKENGDVFEH